MPIENPSFDRVNTAIEQTALSSKLSGMETKRQATDDWAVRDGVSKGLRPEDVFVLRSEYDNSPNATELRRARELAINPTDGRIREDHSAEIRSRLTNSATELIGTAPINEIVPVFTGLRKAVNSVRLKRAEKKLDEAVSRKAVAAHAGTIILRNRFGEGYYTHADVGGILQAPKPERDKKRIDKMERLETKKHHKVSKMAKLNALITDSHHSKHIRSRGKKVRRLEGDIEKIDRKIHKKAYETPRDSKKIEKSAKKIAKLRARFLPPTQATTNPAETPALQAAEPREPRVTSPANMWEQYVREQARLANADILDVRAVAGLRQEVADMSDQYGAVFLNIGQPNVPLTEAEREVARQAALDAVMDRYLERFRVHDPNDDSKVTLEELLRLAEMMNMTDDEFKTLLDQEDADDQV